MGILAPVTGLDFSFFPAQSFAWPSVLVEWPGGSRVARKRPQPAESDPQPRLPSGSKLFGEQPRTVEIGETGVTVTVSDLNMLNDDRTFVADGRQYRLPGFVKMGSAEIRGTDQADRISVARNSAGDVEVSVFRHGSNSKLNLGQIAALTIYGAGGDDEISVQGDYFFGGITVDSGAGDNTAKIETSYAFSRGVTFRGGSGEDHVLLSGRALAAMADGGAGNDAIDFSALNPGQRFSTRVSAGAGADRVYGSAGRDTIEGGAGADLLDGGAGNDAIYGGEDNDLIYGIAGNNVLFGQGGVNRLFGGTGDDTLIAGDNGDVLTDLGGHNWLHGGAGDDFLYGGPGRAVMRGNAGADNFGPMLNDPFELYAYDSLGDYLLVVERGAEKAQHKVASLSAYAAYGKALVDYDDSEDFLVDSAQVA